MTKECRDRSGKMEQWSWKTMKEEIMIKHISQMLLTITIRTSTINFFRCLDKWKWRRDHTQTQDLRSTQMHWQVLFQNILDLVCLLFILAPGSLIQVHQNTCVIIPIFLLSCPPWKFLWLLIFLIVKLFKSLIQELCLYFLISLYKMFCMFLVSSLISCLFINFVFNFLAQFFFISHECVLQDSSMRSGQIFCEAKEGLYLLEHSPQKSSSFF